MANAFEDFTPTNNNAFGDFELTTPEVAVTAKKPTEEEVAQFDLENPDPAGFFKEQAPRDFSWDNVANSGNVGAGIGAGIGLMTGGPAGAVVGAAGGGIAGLAGGVGGELAATFGASPAAQLAYEVVTSGGPAALYKLGGSTLTSLLKIAHNKVGQAFNVTKSGEKFTADEIKATLKAKQDLYGVAQFKGMYTSTASDATQKAIKDEFKITSQGKASDTLRSDLYKSLQDLRGQTTNATQVTPATFDALGMPITQASTKVNAIPNVFRTSPEYKEC
jgi:hypothetical protein